MDTTSSLAAPSTVRTRHPVAVRLDRERAQSLELRLADRLTAFAGSMPFVYLHIAVFALWMILFEDSPWPTLTLAVSLEAIMLSTFVLIGQNRQAAFQQAKADHDFAEAEQELEANTEVTRAIHELAVEIRERIEADGPDEAIGRPDAAADRVRSDPSVATMAAGDRGAMRSATSSSSRTALPRGRLDIPSGGAVGFRQR